MKVVIIQYKAGNTLSVKYSLERIGVSAIISNDPYEIQTADKVILPGVGAAGAAMDYLKERKLDKLIVSLQQPLLGICLGMQLLCDFSEEGTTTCLGIFKQQVKKIPGEVKVPHVGWNTISELNSPLFNGIGDNAFMYFVHSYYVPLDDYAISTSSYPDKYSSAIQKNNFYAVQFHPEKSGAVGQKLLENFIQL